MKGGGVDGDDDDENDADTHIYTQGFGDGRWQEIINFQGYWIRHSLNSNHHLKHIARNHELQ